MRSSLIILAFATAAVVARPIEDGRSSLAIRGVESTYVVRAYDAEDGKIHDAVHKVLAFGKKLLGGKPKTATAPAPAAVEPAAADAAAPVEPEVAARDVDTEDGRIADAAHKVHTAVHNVVNSALAFGKKLFGAKPKTAPAPAPVPAEAAPDAAAADVAAPAADAAA